MTAGPPRRVVTANDLLTGRVVYRTADGRWVGDLAAAEVLLTSGDADDRLASAARQACIVGPYLADLAASGSGPVPAHIREILRVTGPGPAARIAHDRRDA